MMRDPRKTGAGPARGADRLERPPRQDVLGAVGLEPIDARRDHAVPHFGPIVAAEHLRLDLDPPPMEGAAGLGRDVRRVDLDGRRPHLFDPAVDAEPRTPLRHHGQVLGRRRPDRAEHLGPVVEDDLARHPGRDDLARQRGRIDVLEIQIEIHPPACQLQPFRKREDPTAGEAPGELPAGVERAKFGQRAVAQLAGAIGLGVERLVVEQDVMAVLGEPDVDLDPLDAVGDRLFEGRRGVLGARPIAPRCAITWTARGGLTGSKKGKARGRSSGAAIAATRTAATRRSGLRPLIPSLDRGCRTAAPNPPARAGRPCPARR